MLDIYTMNMVEKTGIMAFLPIRAILCLEPDKQCSYNNMTKGWRWKEFMKISREKL